MTTFDTNLSPALAAAILGSDKNLSPADVMRTLVRRYHGAASEFKENVVTQYKKANMENVIFDLQMISRLVDHDSTISNNYPVPPDLMLIDDSGRSVPVLVHCPYSLRDETVPAFEDVRKTNKLYDRVQYFLWANELDDCYFFQWSPFGQKLDVIQSNEFWQKNKTLIIASFLVEFVEERQNNKDEHLTPKRVFIDTLEAQLLIDEYDEMAISLGNIKAKQEEILSELVALSGGRDADINGRKLTQVHKNGSVSYAKAIASLVPDADLEKWRGAGSDYWKFS